MKNTPTESAEVVKRIMPVGGSGDDFFQGLNIVTNCDPVVPYMTREHAASITSKVGISCGGCYQAYRDGFAAGRASASASVSVQPKKRRELPKIYVLVDKDDQPLRNEVHISEKEAYDEKRAFAEAGITVNVVPYVARLT